MRITIAVLAAAAALAVLAAAAALAARPAPAAPPVRAAGQEPPVQTTPWRAADDVIDGWDWSLPPGTRPAARSGVCYGGRGKVPGNKLILLAWPWMKIERQEGVYDFEPLRQKIKDVAATADGVILSVRAAVWDMTGQLAPRGNSSESAAPRWLVEKYGVPVIDERPMSNVAQPFQVHNLDLAHPKYREKYLAFIQAFGASGIPQMPEVKFAYMHNRSSSRGEEGRVQEGTPLAAAMRDYLDAWARAYKGVEFKLAYVEAAGGLLQHAYDLGMGQRNGFVEVYLGNCSNPMLGQRVDEEGYLVVDETCPPIAENRAFGDENEEYTPFFIPRFGPADTWPHRYRESMLRVLQMRRNFVWSEPTPAVDPPLLAYVSLELGRSVRDAPDAWCYLRESPVRVDGKVRPVKNFERWLYQRDRQGARTTAACKVDHPAAPVLMAPGVPQDQQYDLTARRTDAAAGNTRIGFALDDRFLSGGPHKAAVKVTYRDVGTGKWNLAVRAPQGETVRTVSCGDTGGVKTATFFLGAAVFPAKDLDFDFEVRALDGDATISFVRVIRLDAGVRPRMGSAL
jgi:hypothetical protein